MVKSDDFWNQPIIPTNGKHVEVWIADLADLRSYLRDKSPEKYVLLFEGENSNLISNELTRLFIKDSNDG